MSSSPSSAGPTIPTRGLFAATAASSARAAGSGLTSALLTQTISAFPRASARFAALP